MLIGIQTEIKNDYGNYLKKIFASVDVLQYEWDIITDDILYKENENTEQGLFKSSVLDGQCFNKAISKPSYYLIFADFKAYPSGVNRTKIQTFEDFMQSECEIVFMCCDSSFIEIYCKDEKILRTIYGNCKNFDCESVNYISIEQAKGRTLVAF